MPDPAKPTDAAKPSGDPTNTTTATTNTAPSVDAGAALATIAQSLSSIAGQAATATAPPPSTETRPGGRYWVRGQLVDAEGNEIKDEKDADKDKPKPFA